MKRLAGCVVLAVLMVWGSADGVGVYRNRVTGAQVVNESLDSLDVRDGGLCINDLATIEDDTLHVHGGGIKFWRAGCDTLPNNQKYHAAAIAISDSTGPGIMFMAEPTAKTWNPLRGNFTDATEGCTALRWHVNGIGNVGALFETSLSAGWVKHLSLDVQDVSGADSITAVYINGAGPDFHALFGERGRYFFANDTLRVGTSCPTFLDGPLTIAGPTILSAGQKMTSLADSTRFEGPVRLTTRAGLQGITAPTKTTLLAANLAIVDSTGGPFFAINLPADNPNITGVIWVNVPGDGTSGPGFYINHAGGSSNAIHLALTGNEQTGIYASYGPTTSGTSYHQQVVGPGNATGAAAFYGTYFTGTHATQHNYWTDIGRHFYGAACSLRVAGTSFFEGATSITGTLIRTGTCGVDSITSKGDTCLVACTAVGDSSNTAIIITPFRADTGSPQGDLDVVEMWSATSFKVASDSNEVAERWFSWEVTRF